MANVTVTLSSKQLYVLIDYLNRHESDIADKINDYGDLEYLFGEIFEQCPSGYRSDRC